MPLWVYDIDTDRDCRKMPDAEFGRYMRLLIRQWIEGSVPATPAECVRDAVLDPGSEGDIQSLLDRKFSLKSGTERRNPKCAEERDIAVAKCQTNRANGSLGGRPKAKSNGYPNAKPNGSIRASGSGSDSSSGERGAGERGEPPGFQRWWAAYPNTAEKARALAIWTGRKPMADGEKRSLEPETDAIVRAVQRQQQWRDQAREGEFRPAWKGAATWLFNRCWEDGSADESARPPTLDDLSREQRDALWRACVEAGDCDESCRPQTNEARQHMTKRLRDGWKPNEQETT